MLHLWVKVFHIFFVIGWMAGLFYLPRLFVHYQYGKQQEVSVDRLPFMAQKLYSFMTIVGFLATLTGVWLITFIGFKAIWLHMKITVVLLLIIYHILCGVLLKKMKQGTLTGSHVFYRYFNELPLFFMLIILILVVFKPATMAALKQVFGF